MRNIILFWDGIWLGETPLRDKFPKFYANSTQKSVTVVEVGEWFENK